SSTVVAAIERARNRNEPNIGELTKRYQTLGRAIGRTTVVVVWTVAIVTALSQFIDIAPILASAGVVGIALGLGAQTLVKDYLAGLFLILENQYGKGDVVTVAGVSGLVEEINLRRTVLRDLDGTVHHIPNGQIGVASNLTREWSRVNFNVGVAYGSDLDHVMRVIDRVGQELAADETFGPSIVDPPKALRVDSFDDSSIAIKVLGVTKPSKQWDTMGEMRRRLKRAFDEEGIEIPFPQRVLYMREEKSQSPADPSRVSSFDASQR
ncbi:MAG: mechanosensitive ion channel family protein, partial [Chloroflexota bacterium]